MHSCIQRHALQIFCRKQNHNIPFLYIINIIISIILETKRTYSNIKNNKDSKLFVGNIEIIRDFLDVRDVVDAYYKLLLYGEKGQIYNVCSGTGIKLKEIISITSKYLGINPEIIIDKSRIRPADNLIIIGDNTKLKIATGWKQNYQIEQTIHDIINYQEKQI